MKTHWVIWLTVGLFLIVTFLPLLALVWAGDVFPSGAVIAHPGFGRGRLFVQRGGHVGVGVGGTGYLGYYGGYYIAPSREDLPSPSPYDFDVKPAGRLQIKVQPQDAQVFVDGLRLEPVGNALFDIGLLVGDHTVQIVKPNYRPHASSVVIETARTTALSAELTKE